MRALFDWFDTVPAMPFYGWLAVLLIPASATTHFARWKRP